ncbi:MAG: hypothetical protein AB7G37_03930, partial [Solirubrobacteraceae bacterium]
MPGRRVEVAILLLGLVLALVAWAAWPSAGNYDSVLNLVWARELLDGHAPGFEAYAASTPHPLWLAIGVPTVAIFGDDGDRVLVLISAVSLAILAAAAVRLGRIAGEAVAVPDRPGTDDAVRGDDVAGPRSTVADEVAASGDRVRRTGVAVGLLAGLLVLSSVAFLLLAARGYLDMPFLALVAWAGVWTVDRSRGRSTDTRSGAATHGFRASRWGPAVQLLLAGLLRPEAGLLAGLLWLWTAWLDGTRADGERDPGSVGGIGDAAAGDPVPRAAGRGRSAGVRRGS